MQNQHELTQQEYEAIMSIALDRFKNNSVRYGDSTFLCKCYVQSFLEYTKTKNLAVLGGNLFKDDST